MITDCPYVRINNGIHNYSIHISENSCIFWFYIWKKYVVYLSIPMFHGQRRTNSCIYKSLVLKINGKSNNFLNKHTSVLNFMFKDSFIEVVSFELYSSD